MSFVHDDADFPDLLRIVAEKRSFSPGLIEKDYWVTHTLWAIHEAGFDVWFKGGTSLSKGFSLIERFSEDLDLKIEAVRVPDVPTVSNWKSEGTSAIQQRKAFFQILPTALRIPGAKPSLDPDSPDRSWRSASVHVAYPGHYLDDLGGLFNPFVLLEIGSARVTPFVPCDLTSLVHDELVAQGQMGDFVDNRPKAVRCVHPLVTLLEKLDALHRRVPKTTVEPAAFVRHFEDAAKLIAAESTLPPLSSYQDVVALANDMMGERQIAKLPSSADGAFNLGHDQRGESIRGSYTAIAPMFWGPRVLLEEACTLIRGWIRRTFE